MASNTIGVDLKITSVQPDNKELFETFLKLTEEHFNESWPREAAEDNWLEDYTRQVRERFKTDAKRWLWLVEFEGKFVGLANFYLSGPEDSRIATIQELYVCPVARNRHVGASLFALVRAELDKHDVKRIRASVAVDEPGNWKFFEKYGFHLERVNLVLNTCQANDE